jgi:chromate transporter
MARTLCPDWQRAFIALLVGAFLLLRGSENHQLAALAGGAIAGSVLCRNIELAAIKLPTQPNFRLTGGLLALLCGLLMALPILAGFAPHGPIALANIFFRTGALVFGGGHVVLPLLQEALVPGGWISNDGFLAGYGLAQVMPGPLFTFAAYLGAAASPAHASLLWAGVALLAIFLPGLLLSIVGLSLWSRLLPFRTAHAMLAGVNAAVVGLLSAALYGPIGTTAIHSAVDAIVVVIGFVLLLWSRTPPILVAALCVAASLGAALIR